MSLTAIEKAEIVKKFQFSPNDTGTSEVQVALLSASIEKLTEHFKAHSKDEHSRHGLREMVNKRRKLLDYLKNSCPDRYRKLISVLGLRR